MDDNQKYTDYIKTLFDADEIVESKYLSTNEDGSVVYGAITGDRSVPLCGRGAEYKTTMRMENEAVVLVGNKFIGTWKS